MILRHTIAVRLLLAAISLLLLSCDRPAASDRGGVVASNLSEPRAQPGYVIDSILPPGEALRRFRVGLDTPSVLDGPRSRDQLVRRFIAAVKRRDRAALERLGVTRAEYAFLVYPESRISRPPYRQPPDIAWLLMQAASDGGATKLLGRSNRFEIESYRCTAEPEQEGQLRIWTTCRVRLRDAGHLRDARLFGAIVERDGRFKFAGFGNDL